MCNFWGKSGGGSIEGLLKSSRGENVLFWGAKFYRKIHQDENVSLP